MSHNTSPYQWVALAAPDSSTTISDFKESKNPARLRPMVLSKKSKGKSSSKALSAPRKRPQKGKRKSSKRSRRPLGDVSAESISLQQAADFVGAVWKYGSYVLGALNAEMKEYYSLIANAVITNSNAYQLLSIAQGSDYNNRIGDSVKLDNMRIEYTLNVNATAGQNLTRIVVLRDFMNTGAVPTLASIFQDVSSQAALIVSPYLHSLGDRYEVLYDAVHVQVTAADSAIVHKRVGLGINDHVLWSGTSSAIGDTYQGHPFLFAITDQGVNGPKLVVNATSYFVDN